MIVGNLKALALVDSIKNLDFEIRKIFFQWTGTDSLKELKGENTSEMIILRFKSYWAFCISDMKNAALSSFIWICRLDRDFIWIRDIYIKKNICLTLFSWNYNVCRLSNMDQVRISSHKKNVENKTFSWVG